MSSPACSCNYGLGNTGEGNCKALPSVTKKLIFMEYFKNDGTVNGISLGTLPAFDKTYFEGLTNNTNSSLKWYPTPNTAENVADERADSIFETFDSGNMAFIQEGERKFKCIFPKASQKLKLFLVGLRCKSIGAYCVDKDSALVGNVSDATLFNPLKIDTNTIDVKFIPATDKTVSKVELSFQFEPSEKDYDIAIIPASAMSFDLLMLQGLVEVSSTHSNITTTGFKSVLTYFSGNVVDPGKVKGFVAADFALKNATTGVAVTITTATELPDGTYTFVIPTQTSGTKLILSNASAKKGWDFSKVSIITIP